MYGYCGVAYFIWYDNKTYMLQFRFSVHKINHNRMKRYSCHIPICRLDFLVGFAYIIFGKIHLYNKMMLWQFLLYFISWIFFPTLYTWLSNSAYCAWKVSIKVSLWALRINIFCLSRLFKFNSFTLIVFNIKRKIILEFCWLISLLQ